MTGIEAGTDPGRETMDRLDRLAMERLNRGDDEALSELIERHGPSVLRLLTRLVGQPDDALDLCQETFVRVHRHRADYDGARPFRTWVYTIAANLGRNVLRSRRRFLRIPFDAEPAEGTGGSVAEILAAEGERPDEAIEAEERRGAVRRALGRLSPDMRAAVVLVDLEDRSVREVAEMLNLSPRTVESRLYHARKRLRDRLARWLGPGRRREEAGAEAG